MADLIEVYSDLEVIIGQHIYEERYADEGGVWEAVNPRHRHVWFDKAREILTIVNDFTETST